ncbi:MAG: nucleotidyltransferase family protein [Rhodospirillales bacterium]|nr:nucleotidyltransferase family protein [Rhodospirillales bacterium]
MSAEPVAALVLAGSRRGAEDPVAKAAGRSHKALAPVGGRPMLVRVIDALLAAPSVGEIRIAIEDPSLATGLPELREAFAAGRVGTVPADVSPAATVLSVLEAHRTSLPLLVTTADHALLTADLVEHFLEAAPPSADAVAAVVDAELLTAAYPDAVRTFIRFRAGEAVTGCNLFCFRSARSAELARFWMEAERHRKNPARLIGLLGLWPVLRFVTRRMSLEEAVARVSSRLRLELAVVRMSTPEAGIDVDKVVDLELAETILARRGG